MAYRQSKKKALELFRKGFYPPDIAAELGIGLRTSQRWCKEFKSQEQDNVATLSGQKSGEIVVTPEEAEHLSSDQNSQDWDAGNWLNSAQKLSINHFHAHNSIRVKIQKILDEKLLETELNLRAIHTLSLALSRHLDGERLAVSLEFLDINRACVRVEATGLQIVDPSNHDEDDEK